MQRALTLITKVRTDKADALKATLERIGGDINGDHEDEAYRNDLINFYDISTVHFCRFLLLPDEDTGNFNYLVFTSNFDGSLKDHLNEMIDKAGDAVEAIWGCCEGYPHGLREAQLPQFKVAFREYVNRHSHDFGAFYVGYRGRTSVQLRRNAKIRASFENLLNKTDTTKPLPSKLEKMVTGFTPAKGDYTRPRGRIVKQSQWIMFFAELILGLFVIFILKPIRNFLTDKNTELNLNLSDRFVQPGITEIEDAVTQNQITVISKIRPGFWVSVKLKAVLLGIHLFAKHIDNKGSLGGIATIHFARWAIIDNGRYLFFTSNYDGSWASYIGDFVDKGAAGMDLIWTSAPNYPEQGSIDIAAFKDIIRRNQVRTQVFYSAYPNSTVKNILTDEEVTQMVDHNNAHSLLGEY